MIFGKRYFHNVPTRLVAGAFILNSGISKLKADDAHLDQVFSTAITAYPFLEPVGASKFGRLLGSYETTVGSTLLMPFVSDRKAGMVLLPLTVALVGLYLKIPGMRQDASLRPSSQGIALAKDSWLLGIALGLLLSTKKVKPHLLSQTEA